MFDAFYLSEYHTLPPNVYSRVIKKRVIKPKCLGSVMVFYVNISLNYDSPEIQKHKLNLKNILESLKFLVENYILKLRRRKCHI